LAFEESISGGFEAGAWTRPTQHSRVTPPAPSGISERQAHT
jgi:hypothetical protein